MTAKSAKFYIPSLDGIRTVAFFIVFLSHLGIKGIPGGFGVTVFFFLSGYLITTLLRREYERSNKVDFKKFYMRRVLRIWPPFYIVLVLAIGASYLAGFYSDAPATETVTHAEIHKVEDHGDETPPPATADEPYRAILSQVLHYSNYFNLQFTDRSMAPGTTVFWSLAVEEHFYLMFPLLYILLRRLGVGASKQATVFLGICLTVLLWRCLLVFKMGAGYSRIFYATDTRLDSILFGCALAVSGNPALKQDHQISESRLKRLYLPLGFVLLLCSFFIRAEGFRNTLRYSIQGIALYPFFIAAIRFPDWLIFKPLNWGWMRFVGVLSYSLYLIHFSVIKLLHLKMPGLGMLGTAVLSLAISLVLSYAVYRLAEVPAARIKKRFSSH